MRPGAPPAARRFPLIVFAHGFTAIARIYTVILQAWAEAGYVVAAPDFPLSSGTAPGGPTADDYINQPPVAATIDASTAFFDLVLKHERGARERLLSVGTRAGVTLQYDP